MGRVVALDLGSQRIGVASTDPTRTLASPYDVVRRSGDRAEEHHRLRAVIDELAADLVVVGLPLGLDGREGEAAATVRGEVEQLATALGCPVELLDERFTTVSAHRALRAQGKRERERRRTIDAAAAAVLLQHWLDAQTHVPAAPIGGAR